MPRPVLYEYARLFVSRIMSVLLFKADDRVAGYQHWSIGIGGNNLVHNDGITRAAGGTAKFTSSDMLVKRGERLSVSCGELFRGRLESHSSAGSSVPPMPARWAMSRKSFSVTVKRPSAATDCSIALRAMGRANAGIRSRRASASSSHLIEPSSVTLFWAGSDSGACYKDTAEGCVRQCFGIGADHGFRCIDDVRACRLLQARRRFLQ